MAFDTYGLPARPDRAYINQPRDADGNSYLHELCRKDAPLDLIRDAVQNGANINATNRRGMPPLGFAIQSGKPELVAALIDLGAELYFPVSPTLAFNAVYLAADTGRDGALKTVLEKGGGAYVNMPGMTQDGRETKLNALHIAVKTYHYEMIEPLVAAGALVNEEAGPDRLTPLHLAILNNTGNVLRRLLNAGADLEHRQSGTGRTPLGFAAANKQGAAARALVDLGANADAADSAGVTPLMTAAENGDNNMASLLIAGGAEIDRRRAGTNETALMKAAQKGSSDIIRALLKAGANPILADSFNKTALRYAEDSYNHGSRTVLEEAEQKALQAQFENSYRKYRP